MDTGLGHAQAVGVFSMSVVGRQTDTNRRIDVPDHQHRLWVWKQLSKCCSKMGVVAYDECTVPQADDRGDDVLKQRFALSAHVSVVREWKWIDGNDAVCWKQKATHAQGTWHWLHEKAAVPL